MLRTRRLLLEMTTLATFALTIACDTEVEYPSDKLDSATILRATTSMDEKLGRSNGEVVLDVDTRPADPGQLIDRDLLYQYAIGLIQKLETNAAQTGSDRQMLSILGREDLIEASQGGAFSPAPCHLLEGGGEPLDDIAERAGRTSIVILNEAHDQSLHRDFSGQVIERLRPLGYDIFAAETFSNDGHFEGQPHEPFLREWDGFYSRETVFGRLVRSAKALGYELVSYEQRADQRTDPPNPIDGIREREEAQAANLMERIFDERPGAKVVIHVGYDHAVKNPFASSSNSDWEMRMMAARLKDKTGVDPLTISQTACRGASSRTALAAAPRERLGDRQYDVFVNHPMVEFEQGRPVWRRERGDVSTPIPASLRPVDGWSLVEARMHEEPDEAVPIDRLMIRAGEKLELLLPPGRYRVRAIPMVPGYAREKVLK